VSFCEAVYEGRKEIEGVVAKLILSADEISGVWREGNLPLLIDPGARVKELIRPDVLIDAIIAKQNLGTKITDAPLVIGVGFGFKAGTDCHVVIETNRGHNLGQIMSRAKLSRTPESPGTSAGSLPRESCERPRVAILHQIK